MKNSSHIDMLLTLLFTTFFSICYSSSIVTKFSNPKVCDSSTCQETASYISKNMDRSINPCDNFYRFACGNFTKNAVIPDHSSYMNLFQEIRLKVQTQLRKSFEGPTSLGDPEIFKTLKSYYRTCLDEDQVKKSSESEVSKILKRLGNWPVLAGNSWNESNFNWMSTVFKFRRMGLLYSQLIGFGIDANLKNNTEKIIYLQQPSLGLAQEYLSQGPNLKIVQAYYKYMVDLAVIFGAERERATEELRESLNFEMELAKISLPASERRDPTKLYNPIKINDLEDEYPYMAWLDYMNMILAPYERLHANETVVVTDLVYFTKFGDLLERTPKRTLANYLFWRVLKSTVPQLSERVQIVQREFGQHTTGNVAKKPRWQKCLDDVGNRMHLATGSLYVRRNFDKESKDSAVKIIDNVRQSFRQMLNQVDWMDVKTKGAALEKLQKIIPLVAYPDELLDNQKLDDYYKGFLVAPKSYMKTTLNFNRFEVAKNFKNLRKPLAKAHWTGYYGAASIVNAFYDPSANSIQFPAGIMQGFFFNINRPEYVNFASLGSIVGHEITHGFDDSGRRFDKDGHLIDWWESLTKEEYIKRSQCIVNQYSSYKANDVDLNLNGVLTQGEDIADNGGLKEAYFAYETWEKMNGVEPRLPGFEAYTPKQMFWISYANLWCTKYRPEYLKNLITTDPHTPSEFRIIGPVSNSLQFSKDFDCPIGSAMNPLKKCTVW